MTAAPVVPRYGESTLAEVLPSVLGALAVPGEHNVLRLAPAERGCVLLVDGLGRAQLHQYEADAPYLASMRRAASLLAGVPATTATSIASLGTGLPPGRHGVLGFKVRVPGENRLLNHLHWADRVDPVSWQPEPTVFGRASAAGLPSFFVGPAAFRASGLTVAATRGACYVDAETAADRVAAATASLAGVDRGFAYVYWGELDLAGHVHGPGSDPWRAALREVDAMVAALAGALPGGSVLWVTADHGMVDVPEEGKIDAETVPGLTEGVALLGGEPRFRHVYAQPGAAADVLAAWREVLAGHAWVLDRDEAVDAGWFGPEVRDRLRPRIGDVLAATYDRSAVVLPTLEPQVTVHRGFHGSPTRAELEIPLLEVRT